MSTLTRKKTCILGLILRKLNYMLKIKRQGNYRLLVAPMNVSTRGIKNHAPLGGSKFSIYTIFSIVIQPA